MESQAATQQRKEGALEFKSAEEVIRFDAAQTNVPDHLRERVFRDVADVPRVAWWRRWFL